MHDEFSAEFDRMFADLARRARTGHFEPNADVYVDEDRARIIVHVELAGADADSLRVGVDERALYIFGRRVERNDQRAGSILRKEIEYGEFQKKIRLPFPINHDDARATYRDGILSISVPISKAEDFPTQNRTEVRMIVRKIPV
ncbi:MAG TPA: Hsp20/alpha crystallin family protein [Candidatus Binatia bacterium]|nr:Hsp20/alpha crystallin family protein [Candidatus Binatia bacterium]